jgi:hypothetical protein
MQEDVQGTEAFSVDCLGRGFEVSILILSSTCPSPANRQSLLAHTNISPRKFGTRT